MARTITQGAPVDLDVRARGEGLGAPTGLRLRLRAPSGAITEHGPTTLGHVEVDRWTYAGTLDEPGMWEYEWRTDRGVLSSGIVRVLGTGF